MRKQPSTSTRWLHKSTLIHGLFSQERARRQTDEARMQILRNRKIAARAMRVHRQGMERVPSAANAKTGFIASAQQVVAHSPIAVDKDRIQPVIGASVSRH